VLLNNQPTNQPHSQLNRPQLILYSAARAISKTPRSTTAARAISKTPRSTTAARAISKTPRSTNISPVLKSLHWLKID